jgi:hypothetical protein
MADRRRVRSVGRRETPTPQPSSKPTATQQGRAARARSLRSASREVNDFVDMQKPTRRATRQASITSVTVESDNEGTQARQARRKAAKEALEGQSTLGARRAHG